jgi:tetratricopeptide (TPR) repeat protein
MKASSAKQFQSEALPHAESLNALLAEANALVHSGRADEALGLYHAGQRDLQAFQDKWDAEIRSSGDPPFVDWWQQYVAEQKVSLLTNEGLALRWMGKLEEANALFDNALALTPAESANHAFLLDGIGGIRHDQQAFAEAEELCRRAYAEYAALAVNAAKADPDSARQFCSDAALCLANSAYAALGRGDHAGFNKSFDQAIDFAEQHNLPDLADTLWLRQASVLLEGDASSDDYNNCLDGSPC